VTGFAAARAPTPARRLRAVLSLARWPNALIAAAGVLAGGWWADDERFLVPALGWAALAAVAVTAAVNSMNDLLDVEIDRTAHPRRPLVQGDLSLAAARWVAGLSIVVALVAARAAGRDVRGIVSAALLVGLSYTAFLKPWGLVGNLAVAVTASLPFLAGAAAVDDASDAFALFAVAVPLHLARELVKDIADVRGDAGRRRTLAVTHGTRATRAVATLAVAAHAILVTFLFAPAGPRRLVLAPAVLLALHAALVAAPARGALLLKVAMLLAMGALPFLR
jgi:geranylgeranylglycerol-phosphate geranylgeranyltransferase